MMRAALFLSSAFGVLAPLALLWCLLPLILHGEICVRRLQGKTDKGSVPLSTVYALGLAWPETLLLGGGGLVIVIGVLLLLPFGSLIALSLRTRPGGSWWKTRIALALPFLAIAVTWPMTSNAPYS